MAVYDFLKNIPLFSELPSSDLEQLCRTSETVRLAPGEELFPEGSIGDRAFVIQSGQIEILKYSGGREVLLSLRSPGEVIGEMSLIDTAPRIATARARNESELVVISKVEVEHLLEISPSAARVLLRTIASRLRDTNLLLRESDKLAQLGTLTAGIAHELNNPASAAQRGASQMREAIRRMLSTQSNVLNLALSETQKAGLSELEALAQKRASQPLDLDPLDRSDQETEVEDWLDEHGFDSPWELAPYMVSLGLQPPDLTRLAGWFLPQQVPTVLQWLCAQYQAYQLIEEVEIGAARISEIIKALKSYVYLDQAPVQAYDIHEGLNNTLVLLRSKLKVGVTVHRDYCESLPTIQAYGSELNQVWTNLIDNAADAMDGKGELTIHTRREGDWAVVGVEDNGSGIPDKALPRIFDPYFTTKPQGKGTGLGLSISYSIVQKHGGEIKVETRPGRTLFEVWLPVHNEVK